MLDRFGENESSLASEVKVMTKAILNLQTASGHQVLATAGKKILRPGGKAATEQLFARANFKPGDTVLELASSFGYSAIALAKRFGVRVVGVEKNPESVDRARANVKAAGLSGRVEIVEGDIFQLEQIPGTFDFVLGEAILTMHSAAGKAKILAGARDRLKPGGQFLAHELLVREREEEIRGELARAIRVNSNPLSEAEWQQTCQQAGLTVTQYTTGKMGLLDPKQMIQDEGIGGTVRIFWNVLTQGEIRDRVLKMRRIFARYRNELGYIILCATK